MRSDIQYVVIERPRSGASKHEVRRRRRKNNDKRFFEDAPVNQSSSRGSWGYHGKQLTDFLEPLYGLLRKRCGQRWDDVYSEIRSGLNPSSTTHKHVFDHLKEAVELNASVDENGDPWVPDRSVRRRYYGEHLYEPERPGWRRLDRYRRRRVSQFWVHPETNILHEVPYREISKPVARDVEHLLVDGKVYHRFDGTWFEVDIQPVPSGHRWGVAKRVWVPARENALGMVVQNAYWKDDHGPIDVVLGMRIDGTALTMPWREKNTPRRRLFDEREAFRHRQSFYGRDGLRRAVERLYGNANVYAARKGRQLNTKELRRLGVVNKPV
jgi:hypothetical protein